MADESETFSGGTLDEIASAVHPSQPAENGQEDKRGESGALDYARPQLKPSGRKAHGVHWWALNVVALNYFGTIFGLVFVWLASVADGFGAVAVLLLGYVLGAMLLCLNVAPSIWCLCSRGIAKSTRLKLWASMFPGLGLVVLGYVILQHRPLHGC